MNSSSKDIKSDLSIEAIKQVVKKLKASQFQSLTHHDLALALSTVGFSEVCKQFGTIWTSNHQKQALTILQKSDYDLSWFGKINNSRYASLIALCTRGELDKVKQLIASVSKQNKKDLYSTVDNMKRTALHIAVRQGFDVLTDYLINQGFSLDMRDRQLKTPMHYCRKQLICQVLIKNKAKIIVKDNKFCTPVHYAASGADYRCLELLLKAVNVVNQKDSTGKTALFYSIYNSSEQQINVIRILLQNGAKVNEQDIFKKTALHYAVEVSKTRCIPILLRKEASIDIRDKNGKTPLDLSEGNQKVRKIILAYVNNKGLILDEEQGQKRKQFKEISEENNQKFSKTMGKVQEVKDSKIKNINSSKVKESTLNSQKGQSQIYTKDINQVSTWVRQKFFVLMKKLQQSGVKAMWHLKRPYVYTGSWAEDIESLEDLYETFLNVNGPEAAMRAFNILCPYEKPLPTVLSKSQEAFQSFFGENWFSNDPVEKLRNMHSSSKVRNQLQQKMRDLQNLQTQILGYRSQVQSLESKVMNLNEQISHYKKVQDELRKQKSKNTQQYTQILRLLSENQELKNELDSVVGSEEKTKIMSNHVADLRSKNESLIKEMNTMRMIEAANRRKCGQIFLKSLKNPSASANPQNQQNLYDDDAIISLYNLLKNNPPNLQKRFKLVDKRSANKLTIDQFTQMLQNLSMLPQDVMSMHRVTGFAFGRKTLSLDQFKTLLQNRHKNRPMWEKKLIRKMKTIILQSGIDLQKFFQLMDKDGNGTLQITELRKGLQNYNIFMNQNDWSNLFNLLDSDNSGEIDLNELKTLMDEERTGKLDIIEKSTKQIKSEKQLESEVKDEQDDKQDAQDQQEKEEKEEEQDENKDEQGQQEEENVENNNEQSKPQQNEEEDKQVQNEQDEQQEEEQQQPYVQKSSDDQKGIVKLNGTFKIQVPQLKIPDTELDKVYIKFFIKEDIDSPDSIKMVDLNKSKLDTACSFRLPKYKVEDMDDFLLNVSVWKKRMEDDDENNEDDYLGEVQVNLKEIVESQEENKWAFNKRMNLSDKRYEKDIKGTIALQVKWTKQEDE